MHNIGVLFVKMGKSHLTFNKHLMSHYNSLNTLNKNIQNTFQVNTTTPVLHLNGSCPSRCVIVKLKLRFHFYHPILNSSPSITKMIIMTRATSRLVSTWSCAITPLETKIGWRKGSASLSRFLLRSILVKILMQWHNGRRVRHCAELLPSQFESLLIAMDI